MYVASNQWTAFSDALRYTHSHQVLRMEEECVKLNMLSPQIPAGCRIVVTVRLGTTSAHNAKKFDKVFPGLAQVKVLMSTYIHFHL